MKPWLHGHEKQISRAGNENRLRSQQSFATPTANSKHKTEHILENFLVFGSEVDV
jgi:hypothetical protein